MFARRSLPLNPFNMWLATAMLACLAMPVTAEPVAVSKRFVGPHIAQFEIVLGRLQLSTEYYRLGALHDTQVLADGRERTRSLAVSLSRGRPTLQFQDKGGDEQIQLTFKADHQVRIELINGHPPTCKKMTYIQPSKGKVSLRVEFADGTVKLIESLSLWHLAIAEPELFKTHLQPCLTRLDPSWNVQRTCGEAIRLLQSESFQQTLKHELVGVDELVKQLDSASSAERMEAYLAIEKLGLASEHSLRSSLSTTLSHQQRASIEKLLDVIQPTGTDTAMRVAVWMSSESSLR